MIKKNCIRQTSKEDFIPVYFGRERLDSTLLRQRGGEFLRAGVEGIAGHLYLLIGPFQGEESCLLFF